MGDLDDLHTTGRQPFRCQRLHRCLVRTHDDSGHASPWPPTSFGRSAWRHVDGRGWFVVYRFFVVVSTSEAGFVQRIVLDPSGTYTERHWSWSDCWSDLGRDLWGHWLAVLFSDVCSRPSQARIATRIAQCGVLRGVFVSRISHGTDTTGRWRIESSGAVVVSGLRPRAV